VTELYLNKLRLSKMIVFFFFLQAVLVLRGTCQGPFFWTLYKH